LVFTRLARRLVSSPSFEAGYFLAIMRWALGISQENQGSAAQVLGIHRNTLIEKIRKHHLYLH
jgi:DNA-binding protein Fis